MGGRLTERETLTMWINSRSWCWGECWSELDLVYTTAQLHMKHRWQGQARPLPYHNIKEGVKVKAPPSRIHDHPDRRNDRVLGVEPGTWEVGHLSGCCTFMTVTGLWSNLTSRDSRVNGSSVSFYCMLCWYGAYSRTYGSFYLELVKSVIPFGSEL